MIDVRSPEEYSGERTHMPSYPDEGALRGGHIPGAANVPWARAVNEDGTFKSRTELDAIYLDGAGLTAGDDINVRATLLINGARENITDYVLQAAIVYPDKTTLATGTGIVSASIIDPLQGTISATWPRATTGAIEPGMYLVEIQAQIGAVRTTYERVPIMVDAGAIP
jgi:hypothetical protein